MVPVISELRAETSTSSDSVVSRSEELIPPSPASSSTLHAAPLINRESRSPSHDVEPHGGTARDRPGRERGIGGRALGNPPRGVTRCAHCQTTQSPEWRRGPSGAKDLCNAYVFSLSFITTFDL